MMRTRRIASACDVRIEVVLKQLSFRRSRKVGPLPSPRRGMRWQPNGPVFDVRAALFALLGKDLTQINGLGPYLAARARIGARHGNAR
jgi:transposase